MSNFKTCGNLYTYFQKGILKYAPDVANRIPDQSPDSKIDHIRIISILYQSRWRHKELMSETVKHKTNLRKTIYYVSVHNHDVWRCLINEHILMCGTLYACIHAGKRSLKTILKYAQNVASKSPAQNRINKGIGDIQTKCKLLSDLRKQGHVSVF